MHGTHRTIAALLCCWVVALSGCTATKSFARKLNPDAQREFDMRLTMAQVHEQEGKLQKAAGLYETLHAENPEHPRVCHRYGVVQMGLDKSEEGFLLLEQANLLDPENPEILNDLGYAYIVQGELDQGETLLQEAYALDPGKERTINNLALAAGLAGRFEESRALYEQVVTKAQAQANLGYICTQRGEGQRALAYYSRALDLDPELKPAAEALAQLAEMKQQVDSERPATVQWAARQAGTTQQPADAADAPAAIELAGGEFEWAE